MGALGRIRDLPWALRFGLASGIAVGAILSQYLVNPAWPGVRLVYGSLVGDLAVVYLVPIAFFALLVGIDPLRDWARRMGPATGIGLGWYGALSLLALVIVFALLIVYAVVDPGSLKVLGRENPALKSAASDPWLYVALSFLVGACEEVIFRGWLFGTWARRAGTWLGPALVTSAVFAGVHLYYGLTYGIVAPLYYQQLFLLGFAFAATYHRSGGNLVVPAALHGLNDATSFLSLVSLEAGLAAHYLLIVAAGLVGLIYYLTERPTPPTPGLPPTFENPFPPPVTGLDGTPPRADRGQLPPPNLPPGSPPT